MSGGRVATRCLSVCPSSSSMTMKCCSACSPMSWITQMFGWASAEAARASRWKRSTALGSFDISSGRNLSATARPSRASSAL